MDRIRAWGLAAALAAGTPALAADPPAPTRPPGEPTTLFDKMFGGKKPKPGPVARGTAATATRPPAAPPAIPNEVVASALRAEQDAWERRMAVCLKLRQVALDANDEALMRQVDDLERQATALYTARTTAFGVPKVKAPYPESAATILDRKLGTGVAVNPLTAPAAPTPLDPAVRTAEARTPEDIIREVRP